MQLAQGVRPALGDEFAICFANFRTEEGVVSPAFRRIHVEVGWHDIEVTSEDHGSLGFKKGRGMGIKACEPAQFVIELGAGCRIAIGQVQRRNDQPVNCRFDIPTVGIVILAR